MIILLPLLFSSVFADTLCNDGWISHSIGSGACSHHAGVSRVCSDISPCPPHQCSGGYSCVDNSCSADETHESYSVSSSFTASGGYSTSNGSFGDRQDRRGGGGNRAYGEEKIVGLVAAVGLASIIVGLIGAQLDEEYRADEEAALIAAYENVNIVNSERKARYSKLIDALGKDKTERVVAFLAPGNCFIDNKNSNGILIRTSADLIVEINKNEADTISGDKKAIDKYMSIKATKKEYCVD